MTTEKQEYEVTTVVHHSLPEFIYEIDRKRQEGWLFDDKYPPGLFGYLFECGMCKKPLAQVKADAAAKARAAKATKKQEENSQEQE